MCGNKQHVSNLAVVGQQARYQASLSSYAYAREVCTTFWAATNYLNATPNFNDLAP
jgi:hypothetical protein